MTRVMHRVLAGVLVSLIPLFVFYFCFSLAEITQGLQRSAELDVTRYTDLEATNVQLRRQVEQLELLCKEQADAAQQLTKRQQVTPPVSIKQLFLSSFTRRNLHLIEPPFCCDAQVFHRPDKESIF